MGTDRNLLQDALLKIRSLRADLKARDESGLEPIAIVGAGCRFPGGADSIERFWELLREGRDAVRDVPPGRWDRDAYYDPDPDAPGKSYLRSGGFLDDIEGFDPEFFGITPREAVRLDPQHRLLLEVAWEALENAGIAPDSVSGSNTGVYVGVLSPEYAFRQVQEIEGGVTDPYMLTGNETSFAAGRLSYVLGLQGPSMVVATACSSSLVSIHLACQALRSSECDAALAGGVNIVIDPITNVMLSKLRAVSRDGRCKAFDASADGYGRGEGCGLVVLKRLSSAVADGDRILALIRGSAVNHDGPSAGLTVPNGPAQERVLRRALAAARVSPTDVGYLEAHGTGTPLGDPIELHALARIFGGARPAPLLVGSVKTNLAHLESAAGIAGVLKAALSVAHGEIPPHLHFERPNPHVDWASLPLRVPTTRTAWPEGMPRRIAGVSSFGLSGVNAHVVIEQPPAPRPETAQRSDAQLLVLSARSEGALEQLVARYLEHLRAHPAANWADVCFTAATGRAHFAHRAAVVAGSAAEACALLQSRAAAPHGAAAIGEGHGDDGRRSRLAETAQRYLAGKEISWETTFADGRRRVELPTYPFQRQRYWALQTGSPRGPRVATPAARPAAEDPGSRAAGVAASIRSAPPEARRQLLAQAVAARVSAVMGLADTPAASVSLLDAGLDSLMALEIKDWAQLELGVDVDLRALLSGATTSDLVHTIDSALRSGDEPSRPAAAGRAARQYPLTYGQRALWFIHQQDPLSAAYNVGVALSIRAAIDVPSLEDALRQAVARHPSLHARFTALDGDPVQQIGDAPEVALDRVDLTGVDDDGVRATLTEAYRQPFDLERGPLVRAALFDRGPRDHVLLLTIHHIVCDAVSCWTLLEDVQAAYAARQAPDRSIAGPGGDGGPSYADFVEWQRRMIAGDEGARHWNYWQQRLAGELPVLQLPGDRPRPPLQTYRGASERRQLPAAMAEALRDLARAEQATLHNTLLAAFFVLLHRCTGQNDLIVGTPTVARPPGFARVVGYFVNPLPIRADLSSQPPFRAFLRQVRDAMHEAIAHQAFPFPLLVERLQPRRDPSRSPIFQADFALWKLPTAYRSALTGGAGALPVEKFDLPEEEGQFDIGLHVVEHPDRLEFDVKYNADLFERSTVAALSEAFETLLGSIVDAPDTCVAALPVVSPAAQSRLLALGRGPAAAAPFRALTAMVDEHARRAPSAVAVECGGDSLTYAALHDRAERLAQLLHSFGAGRDALVAICLPQTADLVVAVVGILKAGAAYVPMDPAYPSERLAFMLRDAGVRAILTTGEIAARLAAPEGTAIVTLADGDAAVTGGALDRTRRADPAPPTPLPAPAPEQLAYVIYTSGSTGAPKGAAITHGGLMNYLTWAADAYGASAGIGCVVSSSIGFDATITSLLLPLVSGTRVILLPEEHPIDALARTLRTRSDLTLLKVTPAHLEALSILLGDCELPDAVRTIVIGGEALHGEPLRYWRRIMPRTRLINEYGPTETVVGCSIDEIGEPEPGPVPIGRPIANTRLYVLDDRQSLVPAGAIGELCIGGAGVARGYLNRADLTARAFLRDPYEDAPGARIYRSGDLARWRADGRLDFLGRADAQVKIRGHRVELGEIERALDEHPAIADSLVVVRRDGTHDAMLVAYVVPRGDEPAEADLRRHLARRLPDHMLPSTFVCLEAIPLTPHGKVDRPALPQPVMAPAAGFLAPRDAVEIEVASVWEELLEHGPIGVRDNFFDLGGHSLLAVRVVARLAARFGRELPLSTILRGPTIEQQADALRADGRTIARGALVPIHAHGSRRPFFCVPGAGGNSIYLYNLARHLGSDQPFYGFQGAGFDGEAPPHTRVEDMAAYYIAALRAVQPSGPYAIGGHSLGGWVAYEMAQQLMAMGERVATVAVIDTAAPSGLTVDTTGWDEARWIIELGTRIAQLLNPHLEMNIDDLRGFDEAARLRYLRDALARADLYPGEAGTEHLRHILALFKAHLHVEYAIAPEARRVNIALLRSESPHAHSSAHPGDPTWGWARYGDVDVRVVPGDHFAVLRPPHVRVLADQLADCLARAL